MDMGPNCLNCGAPLRRPGRYCRAPECRRVANRIRANRYHDADPARAARIAAGFRERHRDRLRANDRERYQIQSAARRPRPIPQTGRPELPPLGIMIYDDDGARVQCHVCGAFYRRVGTHSRMNHGISPDSYRERFGLGSTQSLDSPAFQAQNRALAIKHGKGQRSIADYGQPDLRGHEMRLAGRIIRSAARQSRPASPGICAE